MRAPSAASESAPVSAPTPTKVRRSPYPPAPVCSTSRAITGIIDRYWKPKIEKIAITPIKPETERELRMYWNPCFNCSNGETRYSTGVQRGSRIWDRLASTAK